MVKPNKKKDDIVQNKEAFFEGIVEVYEKESNLVDGMVVVFFMDIVVF